MDKGTIREFLFRYVIRFKSIALLSLGLMLVTAIARMAPPYILKIAIDRFIAHRDFKGLSLMALCYLAFIGLEYGSLYFQIYATQLFGQSVIKEMRLNTFAHLMSLPVPYFDKTPHGKSLNYLTSDMENINEFITSGIVTTLADLITITGILGIMLYLSLPLTGVVFFFFFLLFLITNFFRKRFSAAYRDTRESVSEMNAFLQESFAGIYVSKAFNRKNAEIRAFELKNRQYIQAFKRVILYLSLYFPLVEFIGVFSIIAILWASGQVLSLAYLGALTFGTIVAFIEYSQKLYNPIRDLSEKYNLYQNALSSLQKLHNLHYLEQERKGGDETQVRGDIAFKDVWLSYEQDDAYALKGVSLTIREGERIGIVGLTGSGKTSLINLLLGFYQPTRGEISIGSKPLVHYSLEVIRRAFGIVSQDVFVFPRTVRENLFIDDERSLPDELGPVLKGFSEDKAIAEDGANLSEGEKQLISIGRVIAYKPRYLILDEATSRIDPYLEARVRKTLDLNFSSSTWIVIAHNMATMADMDRIIVIHDGRLAEMGTHEQLLAYGGIYRHLYAMHAERQATEKERHAYEDLRSATRRNSME